MDELHVIVGFNVRIPSFSRITPDDLIRSINALLAWGGATYLGAPFKEHGQARIVGILGIERQD